MEKFDKTLLDYFAMLLFSLVVKIVELKELCCVVQMQNSFIWRTIWDGDVGVA